MCVHVGYIKWAVCVHVGYIKWRVCVEVVHKLDTLYQCRQASVYGEVVVVNSQSVDVSIDVPFHRTHVNFSTLTSAVGPVPSHSTVTSPE